MMISLARREIAFRLHQPGGTAGVGPADGKQPLRSASAAGGRRQSLRGSAGGTLPSAHPFSAHGLARQTDRFQLCGLASIFEDIACAGLSGGRWLCGQEIRRGGGDGGVVADKLRQRLVGAMANGITSTPAYFDLFPEQTALLLRISPNRSALVHVTFYAGLLLPTFRQGRAHLGRGVLPRLSGRPPFYQRPRTPIGLSGTLFGDGPAQTPDLLGAAVGGGGRGTQNFERRHRLSGLIRGQRRAYPLAGVLAAAPRSGAGRAAAARTGNRPNSDTNNDFPHAHPPPVRADASSAADVGEAGT